MEYLEADQGSDEWLNARTGIITASMASTVLAKGRAGAPSKTRLTYMYKLAGEIITGQMAENFTTPAMERGHVMEVEARKMYEFENDVKVQEVGLCLNHGYGASSDGLVGDDGMVEIKSKAPHLLIPFILDGKAPKEHMAQMQMQMLICDRKWCDFVGYYSGMPMVTVRVDRDEEYISILLDELSEFKSELNGLVEKLNNY